MTTQQIPNRRTLLFDGFLRSGSPMTKPAITTVVDPELDDSAAAPSGETIGVHRRGALLDRLVDTHESQVRRGFYSLLESAGAPAPTFPGDDLEDPSFRVVLVNLSAIAVNPYLPPVRADEEAMERLVQSIRVHGMLEPLQVMPAPEEVRTPQERYWVISGEHRRQAALQAGLQQVPVVVKQVSLRASLQMFLTQAIHTYEFLPLDYARVFRTLTEEMGMTPGRLAESIGAPVEDVVAELGFLELDESMQESLVDRRISADQARVLLEAGDEETRQQLWRYAMRYRPRASRMREKLQELAA